MTPDACAVHSPANRCCLSFRRCHKHPSRAARCGRCPPRPRPRTPPDRPTRRTSRRVRSPVVGPCRRSRDGPSSRARRRRRGRGRCRWGGRGRHRRRDRRPSRTENGPTGNPLSVRNRFSAIRSWAMPTLAGDGATTTVPGAGRGPRRAGSRTRS